MILPHDAEQSDPQSITQMTIRYLLSSLSDEELDQLESRLQREPEALAEFLEVVHFHAIVKEVVCGDAARDAILNNHPTASEYRDILAMLQPPDSVEPVVLAEDDLIPSAGVQRKRVRDAGEVRERFEQRHRVIVIPRALAYAAVMAVVAAVMLALLPLFKHVSLPTAGKDELAAIEVPPQPVAVAMILESQDAVWAGGTRLSAGDILHARFYELSEGSALLRMNNQALIRLEAPALVEFVSADTVALRSGKLVGYCNEAARGFTVETADARFEDLGTEFGVIAVPGSGSEMHVFDGVVAASMVGDAEAEQVPLQYMAGQAVRTSAVSGTMQLIAADANSFETTTPHVLALRNGGQGLSRPDQADPDWSLVAIDGKELNRPLAAHLFDPSTMPKDMRGRFLPNDPTNSSWLTIPFLQLGQGAERFTFERKIDLTGYDPATARIELRLIADNYVNTITLNGQLSYEIPNRPVEVFGQSFVQFQTQVLDAGFKPGVNTLRVEISNFGEFDKVSNQTALRVELGGLARPAWHEQTEPGDQGVLP